MKALKILLIFFIVKVTSAQNHIQIPFYYPVDNFDYEHIPPYLNFQTEPEDYVIANNNCPSYQEGAFAENYSWNIIDRNDPIKGRAFKLTVHPEDHPCKANAPLSRSEIIFRLPTLNNSTSFISWSFKIPDNEEFVDEPNISNSYHKIFQLKAENRSPETGIEYDNIITYPLVGLNYIHKNDNCNKNRDLLFFIRSASDGSQSGFRRVYINNAIKKGEWNEVTYKTVWSSNDIIGSIQIWINGKPVVFDYYDSNQLYYMTNLSNNLTAEPYKINCATIRLNNNNSPQANAIKFGHYRGNHNLNHSIYIDDIRVQSNKDLNVKPIKLKNNYCNKIINNIIESENLLGATNYKFRLEKNGDYIWINSNSNSINLLDYPNIEHGKFYNVQVSIQGYLNGSYFETQYGKVCKIKVNSFTISKTKNKPFSNREDLSSDLPNVFPNPFSSEINITNLKNFKTVKIINTLSQQVYSKEIYSKKINISLSDLSSGLYFLIFENREQTITYKIIKE